MDAAMVDRLSAGEGWRCSSPFRPNDEAGSLHLQDRPSWRRGRGGPRRGRDDPVAACALLAHRQFGDFAAGMLFSRPTGSSRRPGSRSPPATPIGMPAAGVRDVLRPRVRLGADAYGVRRARPDGSAPSTPTTSTARIAAVQPAPLAVGAVTHGLAEDVRLPQVRAHAASACGSTPPAASPAWPTSTAAPNASSRSTPSRRRVAGAGLRRRRCPRRAAKLSPRLPRTARSRLAPRHSGRPGTARCSSARSGGPPRRHQGRTAAVCTETSTSVVTEADADDGGQRPAPRVGGRHRRMAPRAGPSRHPWCRLNRSTGRCGRRRRAGLRRRLRDERPAEGAALGPALPGRRGDAAVDEASRAVAARPRPRPA